MLETLMKESREKQTEYILRFKSTCLLYFVLYRASICIVSCFWTETTIKSEMKGVDKLSDKERTILKTRQARQICITIFHVY